MAVSTDQVAQRLGQIQQNGYGSIPLQGQAALANSGVSNQDFNTTAATLHSADIAASGPASYWFDDPVLQKADSPALQIKRYVSSAIGPWPISQQHVQNVQLQMQKAGYGKDIIANGVWSPDWYATYNQAKAEQKQRDLGGDTGGFWSNPVGGALHFLGHSLPEGVVNAAAGLIKALPGQLRSSAEDLIAGPNPNLNIGYGSGADAAGAFGKLTNDPLIKSGADYNQQFTQNRWERAYNDVNTALLFTSAIGHAPGIISAAGERLGLVGAAAPTMEEAASGGGVVARSFEGRSAGNLNRLLNLGLATDENGVPIATGARPFLQRTIAGTGIGAVIGGGVSGLSGGNIAKGAIYGGLAGGATSGLAGTQAVRNLPVLGRIAPVLEDLTGNEGKWIALRNNPTFNYYLRDSAAGDAVRATGAAFGKAGEFGLKVGTFGDVSHAIEGNTGYGKIATDTTGTDISKKLVDFQHGFLPFGIGLNDLAWAFHTPEGDTTLSQNLSKQASSAVAPSAEKLSDLYGSVLQQRYGKNATEVINDWGGPELGTQAISDRMDSITATLAAQDEVKAAGLHIGDPDYTSAMQEAEARAKSNRDVMHDKATEILSQPGGSARYAEEMKRTDWLAGEGNRTAGSQGDMAQYALMSRHARQNIMPWLVNNEANVDEAANASYDAAGHADMMKEASTHLRTMEEGATTPEESQHYRYLKQTLDQAADHDRALNDQLAKATKAGNQDLINQLQAERGHAGDVLNQAVSDAHLTRPGDMADSSQLAARQATNDFLAHRTMWNTSLDHQNATNVMVDPALATRAPNIGIAGLDTMTGDQAEREFKYIEAQYAEGARIQAAENSKNVLGEGPEPEFDQEPAAHTGPDPAEIERGHNLQQTAKQNLIDMLWHNFGQQSKDALDLGKIPTGDDAGVDSRFNQLVTYGREQAKTLAREVPLAPDAPPELREAVQKLNDGGYKLVNGTDIGHDLIDHNIIEATGGQQDALRAAADRVGLKWEPTAQTTINMRYKNNLLDELTKLTGPEGRVESIPGFDARTYSAAMRGIAEDEPTAAIKGAVRATTQKASDALGRFFGVEDPGGRLAEQAARVRKIADANPNLSQADVENLVNAQMMQDANQMHGFQNASRTNMVKKLMDPAYLEQVAPDTAALIRETHGGELTRGIAADEDEANQLFRATIRARTKIPTSMVGLEHFENMLRSSMGFAGDGSFNVGAHEFQIPGGAAGARFVGGTTLGVAGGIIAGPKDSPEAYLKDALVGGAVGGTAALAIGHAVGPVNADRFGWAMANLPNKLVTARNDWRFALSPMFSLRRQVKTTLKVSLNGDVTPTFRPVTTLKHMDGGLDAGYDTLNRIRPELQNVRGWDDQADAATRMIEDNDMFGIYNNRAHMAYMARAMELNGKTDDEIGSALDKTFNYTSGYGANQMIGRSAMERSANMVFFPFSFDKRLYGAMGSYILDRPAQQIVLTGALTAFNEFQKGLDQNNPLAVKFWENHAPLLATAEQLNPLAHGVSLGEPGGVNRPLLNMFMPQAWVPTAASNSTLARFIPAVTDAQKIMGQMAEQGKIFAAASDGAYHMIPGVDGFSKFGNPGPSTLSSYAQVTDAFRIQNAWYKRFSKVLDYNQGRPVAEQVKFPVTNDYGKFGGASITKQTIRDMIAKRYPSYDPTKAIAIATSDQEQLREYERTVQGTPLGSYATGLITSMTKIGTIFGNNKLPAASAAKLTDEIRADAIYLSQRDPAFYKIYQKNFDKMFGPLEEFSH